MRRSDRAGHIHVRQISRRRTAVGLAAAALTAASVAAVTPSPAAAAVPAHNGALAFTSTQNGARHIFLQTGSGPVDLTGTSSPATETQPRFSPDGREILFTRYAVGLRNTEIFVMDAAGHGRTQLTNTGQGNSDAVWSPDGTHIAFVSERNGGEANIFIMKTDGTGLTQITHDAAGKSQLAWSPRGDRIAFVREPARGGDREIYSIKPNGSSLTDLSGDPTHDDINPAFSPDGRTIVYSGPLHPNRDSVAGDLWMMDATGGNVRPLEHETNGYSDGAYPAWSPDGTTIAFTANNGSGYYHVWTVPAAGGDNTEAVANRVPGGNPVDEEVDWQPQPTATRPVTRLTAVRASARQHSVTIGFAASGPATSYRCTMTAAHARARTTACHSPATFRHVGRGRYTISVIAAAPGEPYRASAPRHVTVG